ncbi:hypothetical protein TNCT_2511 [Trichonephila clavata]|uniref:Uncharacterized protein n=1 Tax=Trichonephila clavata TaxID=2740835 RepID=A0A8X6GMQ5_TRICU|nr:hypothetical protein TNCT_2511 [Trichonephila clavata]
MLSKIDAIDKLFQAKTVVLDLAFNLLNKVETDEVQIFRDKFRIKILTERQLPQDVELFQYNILKKFMDHFVCHGSSRTNIRPQRYH